MPGDVLRGYASGTLDERLIVTGLFVIREFTLGMGEKMGTVAVEGKHQEQLGIHSRRGDVTRSETSDGRGQGSL
jgi:hypothetical protein